MVFIYTNSCTKYNYVEMFCINPVNMHVTIYYKFTLEDITINRHIYVAFDTFHIVINSKFYDLLSQLSTCWVTS